MRPQPASPSPRELYVQLVGWFLFLLSAIGFTLGSRGANAATQMGALLFLVACFVFIIPLIYRLADLHRAQW